MTEALAPVSPVRILLAEDSTVIRAMVRQHLEDQGYTVIEAVNGAAALLICKEQHPDVALVNVEMPVLDGRQLLQQLKLDPELKDIPVIFLTGRTSSEEMVAGLHMGAHDYLRKPFDPAELIARVSAACRVAKLQQQLSRRNVELDTLSRTDPLTGLHNRRHGVERLHAEGANARRHRHPLGLLMVDIDHFKAINDRFGHAGGDAVLYELAGRLQAVLREGDVAARWGGEEFLLILPETDLAGVVILGQRVLHAVRDHPFVLDAEHRCDVTVSIGAAGDSVGEPDELLREADRALYIAKDSGRNQLSVTPPCSQPTEL